MHGTRCRCCYQQHNKPRSSRPPRSVAAPTRRRFALGDFCACQVSTSYRERTNHHHHHHIYSPQNTISTSIQESRGRLPERHKHPSMLAALTTKRYNTSTQMHKNIKKTQPVHKPTTVRVHKKKISRPQHTAQTVLTCPHITTGFNGVLNTF